MADALLPGGQGRGLQPKSDYRMHLRWEASIKDLLVPSVESPLLLIGKEKDLNPSTVESSPEWKASCTEDGWLFILLRGNLRE
ncbi:hypothetical protein HNY73_003657 [Argiope bruennichi]|uniref:Uncharacterized protein n=1 Tax=Argiope bruennichi TaxID=94029 RepID=A0A8T0FNT2_ARGBR|nr:hypothetical protein HNY73_003657 [Argiope bruennichi]